MKNFRLLVFASLLTLPALAQRNAKSTTVPLTANKHGIIYQDDFAWLENVNAEQVRIGSL